MTSFALSQILGVAAQRAITEMRKRVMEKIERLPISYFDSTQSGQLISRIMNDAEGIRNLVGTGLGQIIGSIVTATIALGVLFWINWKLTLATLVVLTLFGGVLAYAFKKLRPIFRERNDINAEVTGRLGESSGRHSHRQSIHGGKTRRTFICTRSASSFSQCRQNRDGRFGRFVFFFGRHRRNRRRDDRHRRQRRAEPNDDARRFFYVYFFYFSARASGRRTDFNRHADHRSLRRS